MMLIHPLAPFPQPLSPTVQTLVASHIALCAIFWVLVGGTCFLLYCLFPLRALMWGGAAYLLSLMTGLGSQWLFSEIRRSISGEVNLDSMASIAVMTTSLIEDCGNIVITLLLLTEVIVLAVRAHSQPNSRYLAIFSRIYVHTTAVGLIAITFALAIPLPAAIYYYTH